MPNHSTKKINHKENMGIFYKIQVFIVYVLIILVLFLNATIISAQTYKPKSKQSSNTVTKPVTYSKQTSVTYEPKALSADSLSKLKVVLVVGPVEDLTQEFIDTDKEIASYLRNLGVNVAEFYDPDANWTDIVLEAKNAHIFIYSGHGSFFGENGKVGGLCLSKRSNVSSISIFNELKLHKNALIIFHKVCLSAGSSASDTADIGVKAAIQRVSDYAHPFIKLGAGGYYANNYLNTIVPFFNEFFNKKTIKQIFIEAASTKQIDTTQKYMYNPKFEVSVASSNNTGFSTRTTYTNGVKKVEKVALFKQYDIAFVSIPDFTVIDFFK